MDADALFRRYGELQQYVGWTPEDAHRVRQLAPLVAPHFAALIDDFYREIERHADARKVITGGGGQIERLRGSLGDWLRELFSGNYDRAYVVRRWQVGWRHVEIGLEQVFTNAALSRLRRGLLTVLEHSQEGPIGERLAARQALNTLLDLDLAIIEDAYQSEYLSRQQTGERLAAIGQVAAGIAHELRNPLNVIKTSVYYLRNARNPSAAKTEEHLGRIEQHVTAADGVITALASFVRMRLPNLRPFPVAQCISEVLEATEIPPTIAVRTQLPDSLPRALGDIDHLRIVFANLIRNASEAMRDGGTLSIRGCHDDACVAVAVADTGVGISSENLKRITEPLFSTKARGLGLGLAIARTILDKNNGSLDVASTVGAGSTFTVRLMAALA